MALLTLIGILFFAVSFGPRFFKLMNFGYGFLDLGFYSQFFSDLKMGFFDPYIPSLKETFLNLTQSPLLLILWPLSFATTHPAVFLFLDEISVVVTAAVCANFTWRKTKESSLAVAVFVAVIFSPQFMDALHGAARPDLWCQPFLALLFTEHFSRRRPLFMSLWFSLLCLLNLNFCILGMLLVPLALGTQMKRWKFQRRVEVALPLVVLTLVFVALQHHFQGDISFTYTFFWDRFGGILLKWILCFWFLPLLAPDILLFILFILGASFGIQMSNENLIIVLGAIGGIVVFERFKISNPKILRLFSTALIASCIYYNLTGQDPFFMAWQEERWTISEDDKKVHDMISHIPELSTVAASDNFTPLLANRLSLMTISSVDWTQKDLPRYVLSRNDGFVNPRFAEIESNLKTKTRLFARIK